MNNQQFLDNIIGIKYLFETLNYQKNNNTTLELTKRELTTISKNINKLQPIIEEIENIDKCNVIILDNKIKEYIQDMPQYFNYYFNVFNSAFKFSQQNVYECNSEGYFQEYLPNKINTPNKISEIISICEKILKDDKTPQHHFLQIQNRLNKCKKILNDDFQNINHNYFSFVNKNNTYNSLLEYSSYGTLLTIHLLDPELYKIHNGDLKNCIVSSNTVGNIEYKLSQAFISENIDFKNPYLIYELLKNTKNIDEYIKTLEYQNTLQTFVENLKLYPETENTIKLLETLQELHGTSKNNEEFLSKINEYCVLSTGSKINPFENLFNPDFQINRIRKMNGINKTVQESKLELFGIDTLEKLSKNLSAKELFKVACNYFDYYQKEKIPEVVHDITSIYVTKKGFIPLFNKKEINPLLDLSKYSQKQINLLIEMSKDNENNPQNAFNIGTILNPDYSTFQMQQIMYLERRNLDSSPIRNPLLNDEQIQILSNAIEKGMDVSLFSSSLISPERMKEKINEILSKENKVTSNLLQSDIDKYKEVFSEEKQEINQPNKENLDR